ncbi:MAG: T9SS type A sorting domain-containing protein [Candidatus Cloacimonetes bacterium]|nr:T9SS type A sorting domain-containing protein [Candidatus Cloacimonadota bacterium]
MKKFFSFLIFILFPFYLSSIEVGGHITEDTTWSPDNNPYLVTEILYVDAGVTLTILPGTEVKVSGASCTSWQEYSQNFWLHNGVSVAKMFWVDGRIIAEGTAQDSITFSRMQDDPDYCWGTIYITEQADISRFEHCKFEYTAGIGIAVGNIAYGAISIYNGSGIIKKCSFVNNTSSIITRYNDINSLEISWNIILKGSGLNNFTANMRTFEFSTGSVLENKLSFIMGNSFENSAISFNSVNFIDNYISESTIFIANNNYITNLYDNEFVNCQTSIHGGNENDSIYIKNNHFIGGYDGINIDDAYVEISDNYFEGCDLYTEYATGKIWNNISNNGEIWTPGEIEVYNNMCYNNEGYGLKVGYNPYCTNNISINNEYDIWSATVSYENCIIINNEELTQYVINGNPLFRNCIIDFELEYPLIDVGGNIIVDSLQAQTLFEDITNGDFHLIEGSLAIDAGFDTLGYYYPFDMDYNHRVWDGDNNGSAIIDIGPYEYNSPSFGGIKGYTYNPTTGDPVDYVLLKIDNQPGEFTFSDSLGDFQFKLPAGIYDIYAERVFYEDVIEYQVEVFDGQFTQVFIPMNELVGIEENTIIPLANDFNLSNYPNPFNPETTISFDLASNANVEISIYNIKGQKVKTLVNKILPAGEHTTIWNGKDSNNKRVGSGIYFYKLEAGGYQKVKKMLLLK